MVEVLDPMVLRSCIREQCPQGSTAQIPEPVCGLFEEELITGSCSRYLLVTLGQFSVIRLERDAQLVVPVLPYMLPQKQCCDGSAGGEDPCEMFSRIPFPENQFAPAGCEDCPSQSCQP